MKKYRFVTSLLIVVILLLQLQQSIHAQIKIESSSTGTVPVSYTPDLRYSLSVHVNGNGAVIDGSQSIRNGIVQYDFLSPSQKQFYIQPDTGYQLKLLNFEKDGITENLIGHVTNNVISIEIEDSLSVLYVEFEKTPTTEQPIPPGGVDYPTNPGEGGTNSGVNTGDNTSQWYSWIGLISTTGLILVFTKKKSEEDLCKDTYKR